MPLTTADNPNTPAAALSVVVPVFNERDNLQELVQRILNTTRTLPGYTEIIIVDDGSKDGSVDILRQIAEQIPCLKVITLRRNYGQSAAMTAGFHHANGAIVISMDGDLQNDPADIPRLLDKLEDGFDVVCGWRKSRKDNLSRTLPSKIANAIIGRTTGVTLHDYGCSLKAYRREWVSSLNLYGELHRFIPVLMSLEGARIGEVEVNHHPRTKGVSKYGITRTPKVLIDLFLMAFFQRFATRPLQFFGLNGFGMMAIGIAIEAYLTYLKFGLGQDIGNRPLLLLGALLILMGVILIGIGLLAELIIRVYYESTQRRIYGVRETILRSSIETD